ncbi:MAG TPA: S8 family serine peptidase, partial [Candidatus Polarisedimenticolia bacterium]|nr:S8 family serine peptidase [Candidatus Polarisedimenticolia bacterium]
MGPSLKRRSLVSAILATTLVFLGTLALFSFATWAARDEAQVSPNDVAQLSEIEFAKRVWRPTGFERRQGLSPLEAIRPNWDLPSAKRKNTIGTALGFIDPAGLAQLRGQAPLLAGAPGRRLGAGKRGEIASGFNAIQISEAALRSRSMDSIASELKGMGVKVHDVLESRGLLVEIPKGKEDAVASSGYVEAGMPWEALFRVDPLLGRSPMIQQSRAASDDLEIIVQFFEGTSTEEAVREIEEVAGPHSATPYSIDGMSYQTKLHYSKVVHLAKKERVRWVYELPEHMLMNVETPTTAMVGNIKENLPFQKPYHDAGVDGGGIGVLQCTNTGAACTTDANCTAGGLCRIARSNNGSAVVPPQIVAVTDNGISADSVQFSQTASVVFDGAHPFPSPSHRKIHAIQNAGDDGSSCDATMSGSGTHGNVVAGVIAGDASALGFRITKHTVNIRPKYENMDMDGVAKGARILMQDAASQSVCTTNEILERGGNVFPGSLLTRLQLAICPKSPGTGICSGVVGGANEVHLHVMPFGTPNFDLQLVNSTDGTYTQESRDVDQFLVNNRDYMVFAPVGHEGTNLVQRFFTNPNGLQRNQYPDFFDGTELDDCATPCPPSDPKRLPQISPPATAKDLISVGGHFQDFQTAFSGNLEENILNFSSKGPATPGSGRTAPLVVAVAADGTGFFNSPNTISHAVWRSRDNDNLGPVDAVLDDANFGTSFAAAEVAGVAALIRDYFAQGFYPTGARVTTDRIPNVSGSLVKAAIVASANFEEMLESEYANANEVAVAQARAFNIGTVSGTDVGIIGNNEQGYGRPVVTSVLPLANWPKNKGIGSPNTIEYPSAGLLIYDDIATAEPPINAATPAAGFEHTFTVDSDSTRMLGSTRVVDRGQLRIALAWSDPPSAAGSPGTLVNDLDLEVESPGPDNNINLTADNVIYDGNNYRGGGTSFGQWSLGRPFGSADIGDKRNPIEAVHLSADVNGDGNPSDSQLVTGTWKVRVKRGTGGATPGQITVLTGASEDANGDFRLSMGTCSNNPTQICSNNSQCGAGNTCVFQAGTTLEDTDSDGSLDANGQPYGLVIAGPVQGIGTQTIGGVPRTLPASTATLDKSLYGCADLVRATIFDPGATAPDVGNAAIFEVVNKNEVVVDTEIGFTFTATSSSSTFASPALPVRDAKPADSYNGILETNGNTAEEPYFVRVRYPDTPREAVASARISCTPNLLSWRFLTENEDATQQDFIGGGCDGDQFLDAGENLTYSITFQNSNRDQDFTDVSGTLSVGGPGANAVKVLNSPQAIGRLPGGGTSGVTFALRVDATAVNALAVNNRLVDLTLTLQATSGNIQLPRQTYTFRHALNSDNETFHYSTDCLAGPGQTCRQIRDFNRNLQIDRPDTTDPFLGMVNPDEDVTFSSLFTLGADNPSTPTVAAELVSNTLGEDLNGNGLQDPGEFDLIPNGQLDKGILASATGPTPTAAGDRAPFNFDLNSGGFAGFRHPTSRPGPTTPAQTWEYVTSGVCGFQSAIPDGNVADLFQNNGAGIWHTGDGTPGTPLTNCDNHVIATFSGTPPGAEYIEDFLLSPIIAKVHQLPDSRGLAYSQEFQRLGFNLNIKTENDVTGGNFNVDNNLDDDTGACLMCQEFDLSYGGIDYQVGMFKATGSGFGTVDNPSWTFGPLVDPNNSILGGNKRVSGDESGFSGFPANANTAPIPPATPDMMPYPVPSAPVVMAPDGTPWNNDPTVSDNGPVRNVDFTLVQYAGGFVFSV